MPAAYVRDPSGAWWTVRRRWVPHRDGKGVSARWRNRDDVDLTIGWGDMSGAEEIPGLNVIVLIVGLVVLIVLAITILPPLLLLGIDLVWLVLVGLGGALARVVLGRPWRVEASTDDERHDWFVPGFRAAGQFRDELADRIRGGDNPRPPIAR